MERYQLKIELQSDLCVSDGGVYNSLIDTDICYDTYGFPYIPAKRLKGCLRECAQELNDWGKEIPIRKIFGDKGSLAGSLRLGNACIEHIDVYKAEVERLLPSSVVCRQNVISHFTYTRTQTRLNEETGIAEDGSLRTTRVVKKGQRFCAEVLLETDYRQDLEMCCAVLKHMGISRTRGLGEVSVTLESCSGKEQGDASISGTDAPPAEADVLEYELYLEDPVVCKSVNGGEENTQDYIDGGKILGILLERADAREREALLSDRSLIFSNAYLSIDGKRSVEVPASLYGIKNNSTEYVDKTARETCEQKDTEQFNQIKHCYICWKEPQKLILRHVDMEERYHHRRPEDKGIGRASEEAGGDSRFYQISSISAGQSFGGYIQGAPEMLKTIRRLLEQRTDCYVGYGKNTEYGKCRIRITDMKKTEEPVSRKVRQILVKLEAPAIVYGENAMYTTDSEVLVDEICAALGLPRAQVSRTEKYIGYTTVGGFNLTWGRRKPHVEAFDKGTVLRIHFAEETEFLQKSGYFIGERCQEGFGEMSVLEEADQSRGSIVQEARAEQAEPAQIQNSGIGKAICDDLFDRFIRMTAAEHAKKDRTAKKEFVTAAETMPTVANMLLMCSECREVQEVHKAVKERFSKDSGTKEKKQMVGEGILKVCRRACESLQEDFCRAYEIAGYENADYEMRYLKAYLNQIKYSIRKAEADRNEKSS
ncbi:MAG: hypothetical protein HFI17_04860 [Lachnospiraceae bacterium]|nr:hypothetical protein [Lachnospiraceae bacterium]